MNNDVRTPELALRLEATGWPIAELWTRLQSASDLAQAHLRRASKPLDDTPAIPCAAKVRRGHHANGLELSASQARDSLGSGMQVAEA